MRKFDLKKAWSEAIAAGTALCRGGCGDRPTVMRLEGRHAGCWCRECWREVAYGLVSGPPRPSGRRR